jgi:uncharacterized protein
MQAHKTPQSVAQETYAAFARGDVAAIAALCADDVVWKQIGPTVMPTGGTVVGKAAVQRWFADVLAHDQVLEFSPREFLTGVEHCTVLGYERSQDRTTGKSFAYEWTHVFKVRHGRITHFVGAIDSDARMRAASI